MKIYGVRDGCIYEGMWTLNPLYKNKADAQKRLLWEVKERNEGLSEGDEYEWTLESEDYYTSGSDKLCVTE